MGAEETYRSYAGSRGLEPLSDFSPGPVTPLLAKGGTLSPALRGSLADGLDGVLARMRYQGTEGGGGFVFNVVFARIPESQPFVPRLACDRKGRWTDSTHYGFEVRNSRLWTESEVLNGRYEVNTSPFQDDNWLRQLFSPTFIDWLAAQPPPDFSWELAYGSLLCSIEADDPDEQGLDRLWQASSAVAERVREESRE